MDQLLRQAPFLQRSLKQSPLSAMNTSLPSSSILNGFRLNSNGELHLGQYSIGTITSSPSKNLVARHLQFPSASRSLMDGIPSVGCQGLYCACHCLNDSCWKRVILEDVERSRQQFYVSIGWWTVVGGPSHMDHVYVVMLTKTKNIEPNKKDTTVK